MKFILIGNEYDFKYRFQSLLEIVLISTFLASTNSIGLHSPYSMILIILAIVCAFVGMMIRAWATSSLGNDVIMDSKLATHKLVTDGPYAIVRHPLYLGTFISWVSIVFLLNTWAAVLMILLLTIRCLRLISYEEGELSKTFATSSSQYTKWICQTPALFPTSLTQIMRSMRDKPRKEWTYGIRANSGQFMGQLVMYMVMLFYPSLMVVYIVVGSSLVLVHLRALFPKKRMV